MTTRTMPFRTFTVGRFTAEVSLPAGQGMDLTVTWLPRVPNFGVDFTLAQRSAYRKALIAAIAQLMDEARTTSHEEH